MDLAASGALPFIPESSAPGAMWGEGRGTKCQGTLDLVSCLLLTCHTALDNALNLLGHQSLHPENGHSIQFACPRWLLAGAEVAVLGPLCVSCDSSSLPSFHIGSGCPDPQAYAQSIADARLVFEMGAELGHRMHILDLGGGFPGVEGAKVRFEEVNLGSQVSHWAQWGCG